jgi:GAF domain-containing protein
MYQHHDVPPDYLEKWQKTLDILAEVMEVPAALVMRVWPEQIEVLVSSAGEQNPYEEHEKADLGTGLYCETVMATRKQLLVPNALQDPHWEHNPDIKLNMINYLGVPLVWPDDTIFGTMCVLDAKTRHYSKPYQELLWQLKELIEKDFMDIVRHGEGLQSEGKVRALQHEINILLKQHGHPPRYPE